MDVLSLVQTDTPHLDPESFDAGAEWVKPGDESCSNEPTPAQRAAMAVCAYFRSGC